MAGAMGQCGNHVLFQNLNNLADGFPGAGTAFAAQKSGAAGPRPNDQIPKGELVKQKSLQQNDEDFLATILNTNS